MLPNNLEEILDEVKSLVDKVKDTQNSEELEKIEDTNNIYLLTVLNVYEKTRRKVLVKRVLSILLALLTAFMALSCAIESLAIAEFLWIYSTLLVIKKTIDDGSIYKDFINDIGDAITVIIELNDIIDSKVANLSNEVVEEPVKEEEDNNLYAIALEQVNFCLEQSIDLTYLSTLAIEIKMLMFVILKSEMANTNYNDYTDNNLLELITLAKVKNKEVCKKLVLK